MLSINQCVVLAGGLATRMFPLTESIPKSLIPVAGKPFVNYQLQLFRRQGIKRVVFCIAHMGSLIRDYVGDGERWDLQVDYVDEGSVLLGTGGALRLAVERMGLPERFLVTYGDSYLPVDLGELSCTAVNRMEPVLMAVLRNENRWDKSNAQLEGGKVVRYDKKVEDPSREGLHFIDYGISIVSNDLIRNEIPLGTKTDLADLFVRLSTSGNLGGFEFTERFYEIGSPAGLEEFRRMVEIARREGVELSHSRPQASVSREEMGLK